MTVASFAFPLNVYGRMLELGEGRLQHLHYGLFEREGEPVWQAQERASERLWQALPPPCRVLEVGVGVGTTLRRLADAGYRATGLTPDAAQIAEVRARHGHGLDLRTAALESFDGAGGPWELLLLQESAQYIEPLKLFEAADRLLVAEGAELVVMDEFALRRSEPGHTGLHERDAFVALAQRMGWQLVLEQDLSSSAAGTVQAISRLVRQQRAALLRDLPVGEALLDGLLDSARRYASLYAEGVYGYRLLRLRRPERPALRLAALQPEQSAAVRRLFERTFDKPLSEAEWQWKYGQGRGHAVGLWREGEGEGEGEGELLAHYGAMTRGLSIDGRLLAACQVGDVMVSPEANRGLGRQGGALHRVSATLLEQQIGWGKPHLLGFGFPNARAMKVAERLGLYAPVDEVLQLEWAPLPAAAGSGKRWRDRLWRVRALDAAALVPGAGGGDVLALQRAWQQMAAALPQSLLPQRDPAWLHHRYGCRPGVRYQLQLLEGRLGQGTAGAYVLREHEHHVDLVDLIGPPAHWPRLLQAARRDAAALPLRTWITASHRALLEREVPARSASAIDVIVPTSVHSPGPAPEALRGRWLLMPGDTDFL